MDSNEFQWQPRHIFRLVTRQEWQEAVRSGAYQGAPHDHADGFIHFSSAAQVEETAHLHYRDQDDVMVLTVDAERLNGAVEWEPSRGGELFPHLYGTVPVEAVLAAEPLDRDREGGFIFPTRPRD